LNSGNWDKISGGKYFSQTKFMKNRCNNNNNYNRTKIYHANYIVRIVWS